MKVTTALLADAAHVDQQGKLFVHGAAWDNISAASFPTTHPSLSLVLVFQIEWNEALDEIPVTIDLVDQDDNLLGPTIEARITTGHSPGATRGAPSFVPQALTFNMLQFPSPSRYRFRVSSQDEELASVPFQVSSLR